MTEFELIESIKGRLPTNESVVVGAGDDCAVLDLGVPGKVLLLKTDAVVEGVHFAPGTEGELIGRKALGRCLSDFAAMAGVANSAVVSLGLRQGFDPVFVKSIYEGMAELARRYGVAIVGGETTTSPERIFIVVAAIGTALKERFVLRSGAQPGDAIFVTGELGGSISGRHLEFEPRVTESIWLGNHFLPHAMIDLSDGLASDLRHVLQASHVGAELLARSIPISRSARLNRKADSAAKPPLLAALTDGEDFELLFTLPSKQAVPLLDAWKKEFPTLRLTCVGKITSNLGLRLRTEDGVREVTERGYAHFA